MSYVKPMQKSSYPRSTVEVNQIVNIAKGNIHDSRTFLDKLIDFFTSKTQCVEKYTKRLNIEVHNILANSLHSLLFLGESTAKPGEYTYSIAHQGNTLTFTSSNRNLTAGRIACDLISTAGEKQSLKECLIQSQNTLSGVNNQFVSFNGRYLIDQSNRRVFVDTSQEVSDEREHMQILKLIVEEGFQPVNAIVGMNKTGDAIIIPEGYKIKYGNASVFCSSFGARVQCSTLSEVKKALELLECFPNKETRTITISLDTPDKIKEFTQLISGPNDIITGAELLDGALIMLTKFEGDSVVNIVADNIAQMDTEIPQLTSVIGAQRDPRLVIDGKIMIEQKVLHWLLTAEQIFDNEPDMTDNQQALLLTNALFENVPITVVEKNDNYTLSFGGKTLTCAFRLSSMGEGRGMHIKKSLNADGTINRNELIRSVYCSQRQQLAINYLESINGIRNH